MTLSPEHGKRKTPAQHKKLGSLLAQAVPVGEALREAGWSDRQASKGWAAVPDRVMTQLPERAQKLMRLGETDKESRKKLVRGRLLENTIRGQDGGATSAKILGSDTELNMWTPELQQGIIVLQIPQSIIDRKDELLKDCDVTDPVPAEK